MGFMVILRMWSPWSPSTAIIMSDLRQHVPKSAYVVLLCKTFRVLLAKELATFSPCALHLFLRRLAFEKFSEVKIGSSLQPQRIPATSAGLVEVKLCVMLCYAVLRY